MKRHTFKVTLKLQGPVLTKSSSPASYGLDAAVARVALGPDKGTPCLPGSLIKGKALEGFLELGNTPVDAIALFGDESEKQNHYKPIRGSLIFSDVFVAGEKGESGASKHRIAVDDSLGSVKGEALQEIETPFLPGKEVSFTGRVHFYGDDDAAAKARRSLLQALRWKTHVGANGSVGFGRLLDVSVDEVPTEKDHESSGFSAGVAQLDVSLAPSGPLCVSRHKIGGNLFESENFIPGNMLAGAVMQTAKALGIKIPHFDSIRFRHAFPALEEAPRPPAVPASLARAKEKTVDMAGLDRASSPLIDGTAPVFFPDWKGKDWADVEAGLGIIHPARELRVRTAIDSEKRRAHQGDGEEGGKLFAWEMVHPWTDDDKPKPLVWKTRIDLADVPENERQQVAETLAPVLSQLGFVSKTKAVCSATVVAATPESVETPGETLALVLRTPAQLADPRFQDVGNVPKSGALDAGQMLALYQAAWSGLSDGSLELTRHFARQSLAGGHYLAKRFQKGKDYNPWLLTEAGGVFVFEVKDAAKAQTLLKQWLATGLPLPDWVGDTNFGRNWKTNPYIRQNGFGEIALHNPTSF